jgi:hypothetical protein
VHRNLDISGFQLINDVSLDKKQIFSRPNV